MIDLYRGLGLGVPALIDSNFNIRQTHGTLLGDTVNFNQQINRIDTARQQTA